MPANGKQIRIFGLALGGGANSGVPTGRLTWIDGLGAINHLEGPSDQLLALYGAMGLRIDAGAAVNVGTVAATQVNIGRAGILTDFPPSSLVDFTGATVTGLPVPTYPFTNKTTALVYGEAVSQDTTPGNVRSILRADATADNAAARIAGFVADVAGIAPAAIGEVATLDGRFAQALLVTGLTVSEGDELFLSSTAGRLTNDISGYTAGNVAQSAGTITDVQSYTGAAEGLVQILAVRGMKAVI